MRAAGIVSLVLVVDVVAYWGLRLAASGCTGSACDVYIPFSLLLPLLALVLAGIAGVVAGRGASTHRAWSALLSACGALGALGPLAALALIKGQNDLLVGLSTALVLTVPASVALYSATHRAAVA